MQTQFTWETIAEMAEHLPPREQLKVVAVISDRLSRAPEEDQPKQRDQSPTEFLALCRESPIVPANPTDAAQTLRDIRDERLNRL